MLVATNLASRGPAISTSHGGFCTNFNYSYMQWLTHPPPGKPRQTTSPHEDKFPRGLFPANGRYLLATEPGQAQARALGVLWRATPSRREGKVQLGSWYGFEGGLMEIWWLKKPTRCFMSENKQRYWLVVDPYPSEKSWSESQLG